METNEEYIAFLKHQLDDIFQEYGFEIMHSSIDKHHAQHYVTDGEGIPQLIHGYSYMIHVFVHNHLGELYTGRSIVYNADVDFWKSTWAIMNNDTSRLRHDKKYKDYETSLIELLKIMRNGNLLELTEKQFGVEYSDISIQI